MYVLPEHLLGRVPRAQLARSPFARRPVGSGRFRLQEWTRGERLVLAADEENYRGRPRLDRAVWSVAPDFGAATIRFLSGEADFFENLRAESVGQLERGEALRALPYPSLDYGFLQFNLRAADGSGGPHRLLADRELRRAFTMAVDRERLVRNAVDTLAAVAVGPVPRALAPGWQTLRQLPYNPARARAVLDSLGWAAGPGGVRARAGVPLAFTVIVPTSSAVRQQLAALLQGQLRQVGAQVTIERLDLAAFNQRLQGRRFDAAVGGWHSDPNPVGVLQTWGRPGARPGGANFGAYESAAFDAHVDSALAAPDAARSQTQWLRAYQTAVDDAPAVWLFEPRNIAGAHRRLRVAGLRPDAWWARLGEWSIPAGERVGRDRVGLR
jgi:peptide/nickel transport system substrate-binding protein